MDTVEVVQLIKTQLTRRGKGTKESPIRIITEYWTMDGKKEMEVDPFYEEEVKVEKSLR